MEGLLRKGFFGVSARQANGAQGEAGICKLLILDIGRRVRTRDVQLGKSDVDCK